MKRVIEKELLDELPASDVGAIGSRKDLQRLNRWMGHSRIMARQLRFAINGDRQTIVELGAGDGEFMLTLARRLFRRPGVNVMLVDQQDSVARRTLVELGGLGWKAEAIKADVFAWLADRTRQVAICSSAFSRKLDTSKLCAANDSPSPGGEGWGEGEPLKEHLVSSSGSSPQTARAPTVVCDNASASESRRPDLIIIANLFLHHFAETELTEMLRGISRLARTFISLEPRRCRLALAAARQVWAIGCNHVTRHDAPASVRAGFAGKELSRLWPAIDDWHLEEGPVGLFSHAFIARLRE